MPSKKDSEEHSYLHQHQEQHHHHSYKNLGLAFFLNLTFTLIEIVGGIMSNSIAILADAVHDLGDTCSIGFSWYMEKLSTKGRDQRFSYGYKRFSLLAALLNSIVLIGGSIWIFLEALSRLLAPQAVIANHMVIVACIGVVFNGFAAAKLHSGDSLNERIISLHLLEDVLGWIGVLVISIIMLFWNIPILDTLFSLCFTTYILWNALKIFKQTSLLFLQSTPESLNIEEIQTSIEKIVHVRSMHDIHIWSLDGEQHICSGHIIVDEGLPPKEVQSLKEEIRKSLELWGVTHSTLEIERGHSEKCGQKNC